MGYGTGASGSKRPFCFGVDRLIVGVLAVAFAAFVALGSVWAPIKMLGSGTAPMFTKGSLIQRSERPALFWSIAVGRVLTLAICVWFAAGVIVDFNLVRLVDDR
jgi:hypothetical protein